jgi:hypothetical protein
VPEAMAAVIFSRSSGSMAFGFMTKPPFRPA